MPNPNTPIETNSRTGDTLACIAWMLRRNLDDEDLRMAKENANNLISYLETGSIPNDMAGLRELWARINALLTEPRGTGGVPLVWRMGPSVAPAPQSITPPEGAGELIERVTRKMYEDWPLKAVSPALASQAGVPLGSVISWERSIEIGADHSGLRRFARSAIAAFSTPEVVDGNQVVRASAQEGTALSSQASPPCGLQSTDAGPLAALEKISQFITDYMAPWGSWKTAWWEGEVSDDAAFTDDNALMHCANLAGAALAEAKS